MSETMTDSARRVDKARATERTTIRPMEWQPAERLRYALAADCGVERYDPTRCDSETNLKRETLNRVAATLLDRSLEECRIPALHSTHPTSPRPLIDDLVDLVDLGVVRPAENHLNKPLVEALCEHRGLDVEAIEDGDLPATLPGDRLDTEGDR